MTNNSNRPDDHTDYARRRRVNIIAAVALSLLLGVLIWTVQWLADNERLQSCFASGRRDCEKLDIAPAPDRVAVPRR